MQGYGPDGRRRHLGVLSPTGELEREPGTSADAQRDPAAVIANQHMQPRRRRVVVRQEVGREAYEPAPTVRDGNVADLREQPVQHAPQHTEVGPIPAVE